MLLRSSSLQGLDGLESMACSAASVSSASTVASPGASVASVSVGWGELGRAGAAFGGKNVSTARMLSRSCSRLGRERGLILKTLFNIRTTPRETGRLRAK